MNDKAINKSLNLMVAYLNHHGKEVQKSRVTFLMPSALNENKTKQVCITIDYTEQDANHDKQS
jgi:hypothetical protein